MVPIPIPPLRERRADIRALAGYFLDRCNRKYHKYKRFSESLVEAMEAMPWKGNIRELENFIERIVVTSPVDLISGESLAPGGGLSKYRQGMSLKQALAEYEKEILLQAQKTYRTTRKIAAALGISQPSAARKLKQIKDQGAPEA